MNNPSSAKDYTYPKPAKLTLGNQPDCEQTKIWSLQLAQIAAGDQLALANFYDSTNNLVFRLISRILANYSNAEEVLLDVYSQVWRQAGNYSKERGTPINWLLVIARTRALDRLRSCRQETRRQEPLEFANSAYSSEITPESFAISSEYERLVRKALQSLSFEQRQVIELAYFSGLSQSEIANRIDRPLGTVKTRLRLGMIKLKAILAPLVKGN